MDLFAALAFALFLVEWPRITAKLGARGTPTLDGYIEADPRPGLDV